MKLEKFDFFFFYNLLSVQFVQSLRLSVSEWWFSLLIICFVSLDLSLFRYRFVCFLSVCFFAQIFGILEFFDFLVFEFSNLLFLLSV